MSVLRVLNRQKVRAVDRIFFRKVARALLEEFLGRENYELGVHLVGADEMARVNEKFLNHQGSTDVITFNHGEEEGTLHGEMFICIDEALIQGRRFGASWRSEAVRYLVHGVLHLEGFDDKKPGPRRAMKRRENILLKELSRSFDLGKLRRRRRAAVFHERK